jgi:hypothetical protein
VTITAAKVGVTADVFSDPETRPIIAVIDAVDVAGGPRDSSSNADPDGGW